MRLPIQVAGIVYRSKSDGDIEILALKRTEEKGGFWQYVSGGLESEENIYECLRREIHEEIGVSRIKNIVDIEYFQQFLEENNIFSNGKIWMTEYVYGVEIDIDNTIDINNNPHKEHTEYKWCSINEAIELFKWDGNKKALKKLSESISNNTIIHKDCIEKFYTGIKNCALIYRRKINEIEILLLKRNESHGGFWQYMTSRHESDETIIDGLIREVKEESGISVSVESVGELIGWFQFYNKKFDKWMTDLVFGIEVPHDSIVDLTKNPDDEHDEYRWVSISKGIEMMPFEEQKEILRKFKKQ